MKEFFLKWGGYIIALIALALLVLTNVINEQNIGQIVKNSQDAAKFLAEHCIP